MSVMTASCDTAMPRMPLRPRTIIQAVLNEHQLCAEDFFSQYRDKHLVAARRDAAKRLIEIGYSSARVGRLMGRNHTTILNYLDAHRDRKRSYYAAKALMKHLTPEARQIVLDYAKAENIKPHLLIASWVNERAEYEGQAKARHAA